MGEVINMVTPQNEEKKLSYEELENVAVELQNKCKELYMALQNANLQNLFSRLDYLFKVVENSVNFDTDFVGNCVKEIQNLLTIKESDKTEE